MLEESGLVIKMPGLRHRKQDRRWRQKRRRHSLWRSLGAHRHHSSGPNNAVGCLEMALCLLWFSSIFCWRRLLYQTRIWMLHTTMHRQSVSMFLQKPAGLTLGSFCATLSLHMTHFGVQCPEFRSKTDKMYLKQRCSFERLIQSLPQTASKSNIQCSDCNRLEFAD